MAPFGLKLWENAFQMIPDISFFDVKKIAKMVDKFFFGTYVVLAERHICPGYRTYLYWLEDTSVLARGHICPG